MNMNTTLKQQLKKQQDDEAHKAKIKNLEKKLNTLLSNEKIADYIKKSLSLGFSACYDNDDEKLFALLSPCKSSEVIAFNNVYEFSIFCSKEQAEKEKRLYRLHAFISTQSDILNAKVLTFLEDDISESDVLNCLIELIGYEIYENSATLVELLEREKAKKRVQETFISKLSALINTKEIKEALVKALESESSFTASLLLDGYNIVLTKSTLADGMFHFYIAELGDNDVKQGILSVSAATISVEFRLVENKKQENTGSDALCKFELKDNSIELYRYVPEKINCNKALEYFKKVIGVNT